MATIKLNNKITKRFIISKSLIGTNTIITFKNKKGMTVLMTMIKYIPLQRQI
jgi:hypothetical protein